MSTTTAATTSRHLNRLAVAKSPYLLQHAENPVDWYEWGPEAFKKAKEEDKPIFLSVGYSACHWCHVLAHESFEDEVTAKLMNQHYVNIKVDREERPDVDRLYMTFLQSMSGGGGWPMSVWLTPDLHPFFAGTYFPKGRFRDILSKLAELWKDDHDRVVASGKSVIEQLQAASKMAPSDSPISISSSASTILAYLTRRYDSINGGFGGAPKFPSPAQTTHFLARYAALKLTNSETDRDTREKAKKARDMAVTTMLKIWGGGIRDVVGGGFARYSVDERWHVPHFEKMLYDQAQLLTTSLELSLLLPSSSPNCSTLHAIAANILTYTARDLLSPEGGFYSAEDADSLPALPESSARVIGEKRQKKEGAFYVWTSQELDDILGKEWAEVFGYHFGVKLGGNVDPEVDREGHLTGQNVLYTAHSVEETAKKFNIASIEEVQIMLDGCLSMLMVYRDEHRPRPGLDDKVLTCWNGLMISALSKASEVLPSYEKRAIELAENAAAFIHKHLYDSTTGELRRSYREGPGPQGQADDYAFLIQGLLDLYEANGKEEYVVWAVKLQEKMDELFYDGSEEEGGGYYASAPDEHVLIRMKDAQDGAEPSAVSVTLYNLQRLAHFAEDRHAEYQAKADSILRSNSQLLEHAPFALATTVSAGMVADSGYRQYIVSGAPSDPHTQRLLAGIRKAPILNRVLIHVNPDDPPKELAKLNGTIKSLLDGLKKDEKPNVRVCENFTCGLPVYDVMEFEEGLPKVGV
ncbi:hypothetical protein BDY19DRAFT_890358 [Irpex rosettiformis]|uniref:Uncharacterized protein n=1 Tax=Irpex rosettiformis TaxID=378272 RepID=A0ACB8U3F4_9APHY|nr:hypothetical protein BDY19DRAFT_890358 [Irpex rosettiformis]